MSGRVGIEPAGAVAAVRRLASDIPHSLDPRTETEARLVNAQLDMLRENSRPVIYVMPVAAILVAAGVMQWVGWEVLVTWWLAVTGTCLTLEYVGLQLESVDPASPSAVRRRARVTAVLNIAFSLTWGGMGIVLWAPGEPINHMFLILILACSLSGASALNATHSAVAAGAVVPYIAFMILPTTMEGTILGLSLAGLSAAFGVLMIGQAATVHHTATKMLRLMVEREGLVDSLRLAKDDSDRARLKAEAASRAKSEFLANMSHELRTPLNAILGFSEIISQKSFGEAVDKYAEYGAFIHHSGQHLLMLINDILDLAKIEAGRYIFEDTEIDVRAIAADGLRMVATPAQDRGLAVSTRMADDLPAIRADERAMRQILINLLSNAVKFTPAGGSVNVFAELSDAGELRFGVRDTGVGIPPEDQQRVFQSFGQGRHDVTMLEKGTGLGLSIVKGLIEAHGGRVTLDSAPGRGTTVTVVIPPERVMAKRPAFPKAVQSA